MFASICIIYVISSSFFFFLWLNNRNDLNLSSKIFRVNKDDKKISFFKEIFVVLDKKNFSQMI